MLKLSELELYILLARASALVKATVSELRSRVSRAEMEILKVIKKVEDLDIDVQKLDFSSWFLLHF